MVFVSVCFFCTHGDACFFFQFYTADSTVGPFFFLAVVLGSLEVVCFLCVTDIKHSYHLDVFQSQLAGLSTDI